MATSAIRLPIERVEQARKLAAHYGTTMSDLIGRFITDDIKRLGLGLKIGIGDIEVITLEDDTIHFECGAGIHIWTKQQASEVAQIIEDVIDRKITGLFDVDAGIEVARVGLGVKLRNIDTGYERVIAIVIARELVSLMRHHTAN